MRRLTFPNGGVLWRRFEAVKKSSRLVECNYLAPNAAPATRGFPIAGASLKWSGAGSGSIRCAAGAATTVGKPASGQQERGNTRAARGAIGRNSPVGASSIIVRRAGPGSCCAWAPLLTAAPPAAATSPASGVAGSASRGDTRPVGKRRRRGTRRPQRGRTASRHLRPHSNSVLFALGLEGTGADTAGRKKVPSDPSGSLFSDRHARSKRGIRKRRDVSPSLPAAGFRRLRISAPVRVRDFPFPVEARLSMRPFTLRRRRLTLRPVPAAGSTLPACIFETILKPGLARSVSRSRPRFGFLCRPGRVRTRETRC
jgi:hypothetical protein